ncbi:MAG: hypothetical protein LUQ40_04475 [Methanomicrobiales archaeon]|nr:hypothetical protein [Methanomicrobiales archaeon]
MEHKLFRGQLLRERRHLRQHSVNAAGTSHLPVPAERGIVAVVPAIRRPAVPVDRSALADVAMAHHAPAGKENVPAVTQTVNAEPLARPPGAPAEPVMFPRWTIPAVADLRADAGMPAVPAVPGTRVH